MTWHDPHKTAKQFVSIVALERMSFLVVHFIKHSNLVQNKQSFYPLSTERRVA